ncbi:eukaryotic and archaeal DNA primase, large subunit-domain-containing protein [Crucibulum laeve]|uniref:DNA primase large subunit n=1 Tax=Crucibulum laeve TaxID=68775 RepID=A0A5C3MCM0_9AGAR|nr:eukaryotic and archaeal DNA primase, large subunit-domain-containing protein [Crucibulum laeve]
MYNSSKKKQTVDQPLTQVETHGLLAYPHRLNFYDKAPLFDVTVEEFEICALDRLRILAEIESSAARNRTWEELKNVTETQCGKYLPLSANTAKSIRLDEQRRKDHLGHFVLRLAFCRSEDLRRRFIRAETTLFKVRYETDDYKERENFLSSRDFNWIPVSDEEKNQYKDRLFHGPINDDKIKAEKFYKVKWTRVPDLVEKRRVFLKGGFAYVPGREQSSIVFQEFEVQLGKALEMTARLLPRLDEDTRLVPVLDNLSQGFLAGVSSEWSGVLGSDNANEIKAEMIDDLARKHFPMCMRSLHESLRRDNHLKHFGRLQYGLFLKVLGLSVEEAIAFWRKAFSRITDDKFNKEYKYNIRHSYGLEGKRANYPAKSCLQILTPGPSEHGCPYRHYSAENLQSALLSTYSSQGLSSADLPEIMATVNAGHFHVACTRVFEITHASCGVSKGEGVGGGESVTHPNQYAARSMELAKPKVEEDAMVVD